MNYKSAYPAIGRATVRHYLLITLLAIFFTSCYHDVDMDKYRTPEEGNVLTLNSIISADTIVMAKASMPFFFTDEHENTNYVTNLDIRLTVNGKYVETMRFDSASNFYISGYTAHPGDDIELSTVYQGIEVTARDMVPIRPEIEEIKASVSTVDHDAHLITYYITFTDNAATEDYYFLGWDVDNRSTSVPRLGKYSPGYSQEPVFQILADQLKSAMPGWEPYRYDGLPFSDRGINGTRHTLTVTERVPGNLNFNAFRSIPRAIKLYSLSKDYYNFLLSMLVYEDASENGLHGGLIDLGLVEQEKVFTNIDGGVGVIGCCSLCEEYIDVLQLIADK